MDMWVNRQTTGSATSFCTGSMSSPQVMRIDTDINGGVSHYGKEFEGLTFAVQEWISRYPRFLNALVETLMDGKGWRCILYKIQISVDFEGVEENSKMLLLT